MGTAVAEYLGMRTDVETPAIEPIIIPPKINRRVNWTADNPCPVCPFTAGNPCKKLVSGNEPVCSVRKSDGTLWINCSERLCSTKKNLPLNQHQINILLQAGRHIFSPEITPTDICVKREERLSVIEGTKYNADYIITVRGGRSDFSGPDRLVLEMQGGGETTNTGDQTSHIQEWKHMGNPTNAFLRQETQTATLETNAWRRQQEQFIVKGNIAMKTWKGYGIAFCVGTLLYDYLMNKLSSANLPDLQEYNWTLALITFKEDRSLPPVAGAIPLIVDEDRLLYTNYQTFVQALINQGEPSLAAFKGQFINLNNTGVVIP